MANHFHYNYEYRKPRADNRTYHSNNAYQSLYHMGKVQPPTYTPSNFMGDHYSDRVQRYTPVNDSPFTQSISQQPYEARGRVEPAGSGQRRYQNTGINTDRRSSRGDDGQSVKSRSSSMSGNYNQGPQQGRSSVLSTYGTNSLPRNQSNPQEYQVRYEPVARQERQSRAPEAEVNTFRPQLHETSKVFSKQQRPFDIINLYHRQPQPLKRFPKLTKEHILLQRGMDFPN